MIVKKFEAPTIQEALDTIKRELGPEAIILQTKKNRGGFGLLSKPSFEITAAVSERALQRKEKLEVRLKDDGREALQKLPSYKQAELLEKQSEREMRVRGAGRQDQDQGQAQALEQKRLTATRYIDIIDTEVQRPEPERTQAKGLILNRKSENPEGSAATDVKKVAVMENELRMLKQIIAEMKDREAEKSTAAGAGAGGGVGSLVATGTFSSQTVKDVFEQMVINGMEKGHALALLKQAAFDLGSLEKKDADEITDQLAIEIMENTEVISLLSGITPKTEENRRVREPVVIALVGPTGVGKTTTVAKIASEAMHQRQLTVGLINIDTYKVAAVDHLSAYASMLGAPFRSITEAGDLELALKEFSHLDLILIDTTGRSQRDEESLREMQRMIRSIPGVRTELVVSATTRDTELYDMGARFTNLFRPEGLIVSKLDEAMTYGSIYNVSQKLKLPLLYFTTGQRVPEDLEEATKERIAALILEI